MKKWFPVMAIASAAILFRFYIQNPPFSFLWFVLLYFPMINWATYWLFCTVRLFVNRICHKEIWTSQQVRAAFVRYLYFPGSLAFAELVYQGYIFNK